MIKTFRRGSTIREFSSTMIPCGTVDLGEVFELSTNDCYSGQLVSPNDLRPNIDMQYFNLATGPIAVRSIRSGDWVKIYIERINVGSIGVMALTSQMGVLGTQVERASTRILPIHDNHAWLTPAVGIPLRPMIGILGVATAEETISTAIPGTHGGNLDTRHLHEGNQLLIRANQAGLLLAAGDLHAAQGDGELGGTGIETQGSVQLRVERATHTGTMPLILSPNYAYVLASARHLDDAISHAFDETVSLFSRWHNLSWDDAYRLASIVGNIEVSQVVNYAKTARFAIPREWCSPSLHDDERGASQGT